MQHFAAAAKVLSPEELSASDGTTVSHVSPVSCGQQP